VFYITLSYYQVYASLLSLLQLFFCLHVRLLYVIKCYLLTYIYRRASWGRSRSALLSCFGIACRFYVDVWKCYYCTVC